MNSKSFIWWGMAIGSSVGSLIPTLWGAGAFSISAMLFGTLGGILGIWLGFKASK